MRNPAAELSPSALYAFQMGRARAERDAAMNAAEEARVRGSNLGARFLVTFARSCNHSAIRAARAYRELNAILEEQA